MPICRVERYHGEPAIMIDGKAFPPMTMTVRTYKREYLKALGEAGFRIFYISTTTNWNNPGNKVEDYPFCEGTEPLPENGVEYTFKMMQLLLDEIPEAYVMLRLNVAPPPEWLNAHPSEMVTFSDGTHRPTRVTTISRGEAVEGCPSLCSEAWYDAAQEALEEYFAALTASPYFDRVIGFFLCAGGTSEWYYPISLVNPDGTYGDFSEPFRKAYSQYLKEKYGTEDALRKAWKRPDASFEHPIIPTIEERDFVTAADSRFLAELSRGRSKDPVKVFDPDAPSAGVFLNMNRYAHVADFYDAWHAAVAKMIVRFAQSLKVRFPDLLVGAFYGSYGSTEYFDIATTNATRLILDSGVVDFLAAPGCYHNREPGGYIAKREMQDSFRLRNMIFINEDDSITHKSDLWMQRFGCQLDTIEDVLTTLKRDFGQDLCEDIQAWWFDMAGDWYDDPDILSLFRRQQEVAKFAYESERTKRNEIAVIYDTESIHNVSLAVNRLVCEWVRTTELSRIGAPVDYYFHNDLSHPAMPDYKVYLMINQYHLTDAEREAVFAKARRNHATVIWLYAPGYVNPDAETVMDVSNIEKTVGMKVCRHNGLYYPHFRVSPDAHPMLSGASARIRYGYIDRDIHTSYWIGPSVLPPAYVSPLFSIDDPDAVALGRYCQTGDVAMAMTEKQGFTSVYCAAQVLRSDLIASIAQWAGCHLFLHTDDALFANEHFITLHAKEDGTKQITFKRPCSPFEVYEKTFYGHNVDHIEVKMLKGETKMWCLDGKC